MRVVIASGSQTPTVLEQERRRRWWWQPTIEREGEGERPSFGETTYFAFLLSFFFSSLPFSISSDEGKKKKKKKTRLNRCLTLYFSLSPSLVRHCRIELISDGDHYSESREEWIKTFFFVCNSILVYGEKRPWNA